MIYNTDHNAIFTSDVIRNEFLTDCSALYSAQDITCIDVQAGSVIVTYQGLPHNLDIVFNQQISDGHLQVPDFPQMPVVSQNCLGSWSVCTSACETSDERTFTVTQQKSGSGTDCPTTMPDSLKCITGSGACIAAAKSGTVEDDSMESLRIIIGVLGVLCFFCSIIMIIMQCRRIDFDATYEDMEGKAGMTGGGGYYSSGTKERTIEMEGMEGFRETGDDSTSLSATTRSKSQSRIGVEIMGADKYRTVV